MSKALLRSLIVSLPLLGGCVAGPVADTRPLLSDALLEGLSAPKTGSKLAWPFIRAAVDHLGKRELVEASAGFNRALKFDPQDPNLHFLNALTYHLRAESGDTSQFEYADVGYRVTLQYDPGNYWAAYQLGRIAFRNQRYAEAQDAFAYALLLEQDNLTFRLALAVASYYARDLATALSAVTEATAQAPDDPRVYRVAAMVNAAVGRQDQANAYLYRYQTQSAPNKFKTAHLAARIGDWARVHRQGGFVLAQSIQDTSDILGPTQATEGLAPSTDQSEDEPASGDAGGKAGTGAKGGVPRMCLIDVTIIRSEERNTTNKGVNLLSGLQATLDSSTTLFQYSRSRTQDWTGGGAAASERTRAYGVRVTPAAVTYNLNIFNDNLDLNEVLARPSLLALDGKASEFFSGAVWHVELPAVAGSYGTVADIPIGIRLKVTPRFIDEETVEINVEAARAFVEDRSSEADFNNFAQTTKTTVTSNVAMKFDQTLILSGLSEKETESIKDGVPFLQNIPGVQYLFSNKTTADFNKSVLILLTPRQPHFVYADGTRKTSGNAQPKDTERPSLEELRNSPNWFKPAPIYEVVFKHLGDGALYREFRAGDVTLETWDDPDSFSAMVERSLSFLYY
jgi:general secretion pathway protein D